MKERWILKGSFGNKDKYFESFVSVFDMLDRINQIYSDWKDNWRLYDDSEIINPFSLEMEQDISKEEKESLYRNMK